MQHARQGLSRAPHAGRAQGTKLLFYDSKSDVLLLDIPGAIPDAFGAWKLGFDAQDEVPDRALVIHHPVGNIARISYANSSCGPLCPRV